LFKLIRLSESDGANPSAVIASSGDRHRTLQDDPMGIRKSIASGLMATANALAQDQTKERTQKLINRARHKLADAIKPKTIRDTKWVDDMFNV
jgi:hypothetical protein|tara:strand:+ start:132 stop:410 length:279 start_codon:yes stop_codon:yes gene_type:complete